MDDHSRFVVSFGLHASQSATLVLEVLRAAISSYQPPEEILTDNGSQYVTPNAGRAPSPGSSRSAAAGRRTV